MLLFLGYIQRRFRKVTGCDSIGQLLFLGYIQRRFRKVIGCDSIGQVIFWRGF
jgi:hypothetical protein